MRSLRTAAAALALLGTPRALASPQESGDNSNDSDGQVVCAEGLYIVVARGTTEDETGGVTNPLAMEIMEQVPGSEIINLDYPATFTDPGYGDSQTEGAIQLQEVVLDYTSSCPDSKLAIMGYSQGAHASVDAVCGGYSWFNELEPLAVDLIEDNVVAIVLFGDPTFVANRTYDRGTSINDGIFSRDNVTLCERYDDFLVSYCDTGDVYCDSGDVDGVHGLYVETYGDEVLEYVVSRWEDSQAGGDDGGDGGGGDSGDDNAGNGDSADGDSGEGDSDDGQGDSGDAGQGAGSGEGSGDGEGAAPMMTPGAMLMLAMPLAAMLLSSGRL